MRDLRRVTRVLLDRLGVQAKPRPAVLMYHRVADLPFDPWGLAVSPRHFEEQLAVIAAWRTPLHAGEFARRLVGGTLPADAVAVTFDDGYVDNLRAARPLLVAANVPATLFLSTGTVDAREYWWDELQRLVFTSPGNPETVVEIGGESLRLAWEDGPAAPRPGWRAWQPAASRREAAYYSVWGKLRLLPPMLRDRGMATLRAAIPTAAAMGSGRPMTQAEVAEHLAGGLIELAAHTVHHPVLPALTPAERRAEIAGSKAACEAIAGRPVDGFAYPHGDLDDATRADVRAAGFRWACSTVPGPVRGARIEPLALPRFQAQDIPGSAFERVLRLM